MVFNNRFVKDLLLLALGAAGGFYYARHPQVTNVALPGHIEFSTRHYLNYFRAHATDVIFWGTLILLVLFLLGGDRGGKRSRSRR
jgi:hypothetical protein